MRDTFTSRWHGRSLKRIERRMEKTKARLEALRAKKDAHQITPAQFSRKKSVLDNKLRSLSARERTLRGAIKVERERAARQHPTAAR